MRIVSQTFIWLKVLISNISCGKAVIVKSNLKWNLNLKNIEISNKENNIFSSARGEISHLIL